MIDRASSVGLYEYQPAITREPKQDLDADAFMQLLVAQLRYQDPLKGTDQQQFMSQLATLSSMQQQFSINDQLSLLVRQNQLAPASNLIGKTVSGYVGENLVQGKVDGITVVDGKAQLRIGQQTLAFDDVIEVA